MLEQTIASLPIPPPEKPRVIDEIAGLHPCLLDPLREQLRGSRNLAPMSPKNIAGVYVVVESVGHRIIAVSIQAVSWKIYPDQPVLRIKSRLDLPINELTPWRL